MNELSLNMQNNLHEMRLYWYMFFKVKIDYTVVPATLATPTDM